ncbi:integrase core domain-containing protein [Arthrobacter sp. UCD-GKA]|uniref:integrase core domain-containing protein n=1 Tax=Arthrobacter sp. UCD-GKA TaxID=1913576 RepID=UPI001C3132DA|nr:integrase core domain-containing protein [Arthrobacter sp. UCD-GKA]
MITGKPYKPTTQGKNERFHQTLFRYLDKQPIAATLDEMQQQVDRFDTIYNTQRPHQSLPGRITPQQAWEATPVAEPPRPQPRTEPPAQESALIAPQPPLPNNKPSPATSSKTTGSLLPATTEGHHLLKVYSNGTVRFSNVVYSLTTRMAHRTVGVHWDPHGITFIDAEGQILAEFDWPPKGIAYRGMKNARNAYQPGGRE